MRQRTRWKWMELHWKPLRCVTCAPDLAPSTLYAEVGAGLPRVVIAKLALIQASQNLIDNAIKHGA